MKDLLDYQRFRIETLQSRVCELESLLNRLETYCFELADEDCPKDYKVIIKRELYNLKTK